MSKFAIPNPQDVMTTAKQSLSLYNDITNQIKNDNKKLVFIVNHTAFPMQVGFVSGDDVGAPIHVGPGQQTHITFAPHLLGRTLFWAVITSKWRKIHIDVYGGGAPSRSNLIQLYDHHINLNYSHYKNWDDPNINKRMD
ncbi:hypothetical protein DFA_08804 [Cavenderia fasciculata]|uniref:Uncharacterized protein n=1 Tax=Cavenderia fasciculata TaxID=261658 RepID=F4Q4F5_CACFS|nr:uncharacterized protein DFA_08804 [Cavenderia fasciculata]EGG17804.1 hypothetical protein DFA_08804 [Cavenderia fasciculata]|eukprot:XP_004356288.1 hypothetical protein DFA_08804 [Cavenderia fasciculata]